MTEPHELHTILASALLAGHTLLIRQRDEWIAQEILPDGRLAAAGTAAADPTAWGWRGRPAR